MTARSVEHAIAALAARQHGVVTRAQLRDVGLTDHQVDHRAGSGRLARIHRGVYRVGPVRTPRSAEMAAVLACGPRAVVSHWSALALWGVRRPGKRGTLVDVALPGGERRRPGLRIHRLPSLRDTDIARVDGIPTTRVARAVFDVAGYGPRRAVERAFAEAVDRGLATAPELRGLVARHPGAPGTRRLADLLATDPALTRSEAEERLLALVRKAGLPEPRLNVRVEGMEVDFFWAAERLIVEVDGFVFHGSRGSFRQDRSRDATLTAAGYRVVRLTWDRITGDPIRVAAQVAGALAQAR